MKSKVNTSNNMTVTTNNNNTFNINIISNNNSKKPVAKQIPEKKMDEMILELRELITSDVTKSNNNSFKHAGENIFDSNSVLNKIKKEADTKLAAEICLEEHPAQQEQELYQHTSGLRIANTNLTKTKTNNNNRIDIPSLISESSRLLESRKEFICIKPSIKGRVMAASELLKEETDMIKSYVKDKIESELFNYDNNHYQEKVDIYSPEVVNDKHMLRLEQERQLLINKQREELERETQRRQQLISQVKEFQTDSRVNVDVHEINSLIFKEEPESMYLLAGDKDSGISMGKQVKSRSNELKCSSLLMSEVYDQHEEEMVIGKIISNKNENTNIKQKFIHKHEQSHHHRELQFEQIEGEEEYFNEEQFVEIQDDIETSSNNNNNINIDEYESYYHSNSRGDYIGNNPNETEETRRLRKLLNKHPNFVKVFYEFLQNQYDIVKINAKKIHLLTGGIGIENIYGSSPENTNKNNNNNNNSNGNYMWKNQKIKPFSLSTLKNTTNNINKNNRPLNTTNTTTNPNKETLTAISQTYKFKPFQITSENTKIEFERQKISERRVNKMIGESTKFHAKKCILTKNELIYYEEKENTSNKIQEDNSRGNYVQRLGEMAMPETTKHIQLEIQRVQSEVFKKEEGSFFSKKEINTEIVSVKGKARTFTFEYEFLEGKELVSDLRKLMAAKVHALGCKVNGSNNLPLLQFIYNTKSPQFTLNQQSIAPVESYLVKEDREKHINILIDSLLDHPNLSVLNLSNTPLQQNEISVILKSCKTFPTLNSINLTNIRLSKQNFMELCQLINDIKTPSTTNNGIEVILRNCKLDDDSFLSNIGMFTTFCTKVSKLDLSQNAITAKTIQVIKTCLESATSNIKELNISNCPIRDLTKLNGLIKESQKLEILIAENCSLYFDEKRFEEMERFFDFLKFSNTNIRYINLSGNGGLSRREYGMIESVWYEKKIEELVVDLDLEMLKEEHNSIVGGNNNNSNNMGMRNMLNMRIYEEQEKKRGLILNN